MQLGLDKVAICFIADDNFRDGTLTMLYSLLRSNEGLDLCKFLCFYDNNISILSTEVKEEIRVIAPNTEFLEIRNENYRSFPTIHKGHNVSLLKFEVFKLSEYDAALYLDTDMLIRGAIINKFLEFSSPGHCIVGIENRSRSKRRKHFQFKTFPMNTGIFSVDLRDREEIGLIYENLHQGISLLISAGKKEEMIDQPILNNVLSDLGASYISLPVYYNYRETKGADDSSCKVVHFINRSISDQEKPWDVRKEEAHRYGKFYADWWKCFDEMESSLFSDTSKSE